MGILYENTEFTRNILGDQLYEKLEDENVRKSDKILELNKRKFDIEFENFANSFLYDMPENLKTIDKSNLAKAFIYYLLANNLESICEDVGYHNLLEDFCNKL